jgi:hypothetical protein
MPVTAPKTEVTLRSRPPWAGSRLQKGPTRPAGGARTRRHTWKLPHPGWRSGPAAGFASRGMRAKVGHA